MRELTINNKTIRLQLGDITTFEGDAIVNAANSGLRGGGGVDGAIHAAGGPSIMEECKKIGGCPTGQARITRAGRLPVRYVIHAVGPIWQGGRQGEPDLLTSAYRSALELAEDHHLLSIAFPAISAGIYGYPLDQSAYIALWTVADHLRSYGTLSSVTFVLYNEQVFKAYEAALDEIAPSFSDKSSASDGQYGFGRW